MRQYAGLIGVCGLRALGLLVHPEIGRAEAMRISMRELIEKGSPVEAQPSQWAPFVVVGEGAAST
jgi:hypothetical protein